jgi:hypothetical protein
MVVDIRFLGSASLRLLLYEKETSHGGMTNWYYDDGLTESALSCIMTTKKSLYALAFQWVLTMMWFTDPDR